MASIAHRYKLAKVATWTCTDRKKKRKKTHIQNGVQELAKRICKLSTSSSLMHTGTLVPQNTVYFVYEFDLNRIFVFLTLCFLLVGVIIWKFQRIQTPTTRTLVFLTLCFTLVGVMIWKSQHIATNSQNLHSCTHPTKIQTYLRHPNKVICLSQIKTE